MLVIKYVKEGKAKYLSHIEILRAVNRTISRAGLEVTYSGGFNPHTEIYFAPPLALGVESEVEYFAILSDQLASEFVERFNKCSIEGIRAVRGYNLHENVKLQSIIEAARYTVDVSLTDSELARLNELMASNELMIEVFRKGNYEQANVREKVYKFEATNGGINMLLATGNINLRADKLIERLSREFSEAKDYSITKTCQYVKIDDKYIDIDKFLCDKEIR